MPIIDESQLDPIGPTDLGNINAFQPTGGRIISEADLDPDPIYGIGDAVSSGVPFSDELGAAFSTFGKKTLGELGDVLTGNDFVQGGWGDVYDQQLARRRREQDKYFAENPVTANVASLGGSALIPLGKIDTARKAAMTGAGIGSVYGFAGGEDGIVNRLEDALWGAGIGGVATPLLYGGGKLLEKGYSALKNIFRPDIEGKAGEVAKETLARYTDPDTLAAALDNPAPEIYPGTMRVAERANDPGLMGLTKTLEKTIPEVGERGRALDAERQAKRIESFLQAQGPIPSKEKTGTLVREGLEEGLETIKGKVKGQFSKAKGEVGVYPAKIAAEDALQLELADGIGIPPTVESFIRTFQKKPNKMSIHQMQAFRSKTGSMLSSLRQSPDPSAQAGHRVLSKMFGALSDIEKIAAETGKGITKGTQKALTKGRELRKAQGQQFETSATGSILKKDRFKNYRASDTRVVNKALSGPEESRQVMQGLKGQDRSKEALRSRFMEQLKAKSTNDEGFTNRVVNNWKSLQPVAKEVLTPTQSKVIDKVVKDVASRSRIEQKAFAPSKNQSLTSQGESSARLVKDAVAAGINRRLGIFSKVFKFIGDEKANKIKSRVDEILIDLAFDDKFAKDFLSKKPTQEAVKRIGGALLTRAGIAPEILRENFLGDQTEKKEAPLRPVEEAFNEIQAKQEKKMETPKVLSAKRMKADEAPPKLIEAVIKQESNNNPNAIGPKTKYGHAKGAMQLLDSTAKEVLKEMGKDPESWDPFNEKMNKEVGTHYLNKMLKLFKGDVKLALAAYNWGQGNLKKLLSKYPGKSFDDLKTLMPSETQKYVANISKSIKA